MSITRNRELSQFGSFIFVDNTNENIGITSGAIPYVGIGTTSPSVKLEVIGDTNISGSLSVNTNLSVSGLTTLTGNTTIVGDLNASSFLLNGNPLVNPQVQYWSLASNGNDIYELQGNVGIGTSVFTQKLTVDGNVSAGQFISTVTSGTAPLVVLSDTQVTNLNASYLRGKIGPSGNIVGDVDTQTLTNKTLNSSTISAGGIKFSGSTSGTTNLQVSAVASGTITIPAATDTLLARNTTDTLTNKTIAAGSNTITGLTNTNLSGSAGITNANLANSTISGVALGGSLNSLTFGSYLTGGTSYNGSSAVSVSVAGTSVNTANTLVARNISGDFTAGTVNVTNLTASQTVQAQNFNSTSDETLKTNIKTVENSLETVQSLRGVSFDWKESGKKSYGVIAQELEQILPELVNIGEIKSVNYNGLIGVLIEAIKELGAEIEDLKKDK